MKDDLHSSNFEQKFNHVSVQLDNKKGFPLFLFTFQLKLGLEGRVHDRALSTHCANSDALGGFSRLMFAAVELFKSISILQSFNLRGRALLISKGLSRAALKSMPRQPTLDAGQKISMLVVQAPSLRCPEAL